MAEPLGRHKPESINIECVFKMATLNKLLASLNYRLAWKGDLKDIFTF